MNPTEQDHFQPYKECAGTRCSNKGKHYLKIRYVNKTGWFCESCKKSLSADGLIYDADNTFQRRARTSKIVEYEENDVRNQYSSERDPF